MRITGRVCFLVLAVLLLVSVSAKGERDPYEEYQLCQHQCQQETQGGYSRRKQCQQGCAEQLQRRQQEQGRGEGSDHIYVSEQEKQEQNPYVFEDQHFTTGLQTQHGRLRILQNFAERSKLLLGIGNYRVAVLEAQPHTFIVPNHLDADALLYVAQGEGTVSVVSEDNRESFNIREGDIFWLSAGTPTYLINRRNNQNLVIAKLLQPVAVPGRFEAFFGAGGENPESFYRAFSDEILDAALNARRDIWKRLFRQRQGAILKASEEQIRAMSREEGGIWPFGGQMKGSVINIHEQRPLLSNQYGQLHVVDSGQHRQLQDKDVSISLANISQGAMTTPFYNSKATKITIVVDGEGYFEMACPHLSSQQQGGQPSYQKVSSPLKRGTVVVVPAGHPFVAVASNNQNLQLLSFEVNSKDNQRYHLTGRRNIINQLEREAKELAFGVSAKEVDDVFRSQNDEGFVKGPRQQGRADA